MPEKFVRDRITWTAYAFLALYSYFINSIGPITPFLKDEMGLSYTEGSLHYTAFAVGILTVGFFGDRVVSRLGRWRSLWLAAFGLSLGSLLLVLGRIPALTIGASFIMGLVGSLVLIVVPSTLSDRHGEQRAVALAEANVIASAVAAAVPFLLGFCARSLGDWRPAIAVAAAVPLAMFAIFGRAGGVADAPPSSRSRGESRSMPALFWAYWIGILLAVSAEFGMISWSADYMVVSTGLGKADATQALGLFMVAMIGGRLAESLIVNRLRPRILMIIAILVALAGFLAFWLGGTPVLVLAGLFVTGFGIAALYPLVLAFAIGAAGERSVRASAYATLASGSAILALPLILGRLADSFGMRTAFLVIPLVLTGLLAITILPKGRVRR